jgi:hypothetical protein
MLAIIALVLVAIVALAILGFTMHLLFSLLFSPLVLVVIAILLWIRFRPRRYHQ